METGTENLNCQRCGWCCKNVNINVSYQDILRWSKEGRLDILRAVSYIDDPDPANRGFYITKTVSAPKRPCPFYKRGECSIYDTRPRACAEFPMAYTAEERAKIECPALAEFELPVAEARELRKNQAMDFIVAEDRKSRLLRILAAARQIEQLTLEILQFGNDPTEELWVSGFDSTDVAWTEVGGAPYLDTQNEPNDYVWTATKKAHEGNWSFDNTSRPPTDTLNGVDLYVYGQSDSGIDRDSFLLWDGAGWNDAGLGAFPNGSWGWVSVDVSAILDTWAKVDGAELRIEHDNSGDQTDVDAAYLLVDYTGIHSGVVALSGTGTLTAIGQVVGGAVTGIAALSGTGALSAVGDVTVVGIAALSGTGALDAIGTVVALGIAALPGTGVLSASGTVITAGIAALSGTGALQAVASVTTAGIAALSGTGALQAVGLQESLAIAALTGTGALSAVGLQVAPGVAALSGQGDLSAVGTVGGAVEGTAQLSGTGALSAIGLQIADGIAALTGTGGLTASGLQITSSIAALTGTGSLTASGLPIALGVSTLTGTGSLTAIGLQIASAIAALSGTGALSAVGEIAGEVEGRAALSGTGALSTIGQGLLYGNAALSGTGDLSAQGLPVVLGVAALGGTGDLSARGLLIAVGAGALTGTGDLTAIGQVIVGATFGVANLSGTGTLSAIALQTALAIAILAGSGLLQVVGETVEAAAQDEGTYGIWEPHEHRPPTGNLYVAPDAPGAPEGNDNDGPFGPWRSGGKA